MARTVLGANARADATMTRPAMLEMLLATRRSQNTILRALRSKRWSSLPKFHVISAFDVSAVPRRFCVFTTSVNTIHATLAMAGTPKAIAQQLARRADMRNVRTRRK